MNKTLGGQWENGLADPLSITPHSRFSLGYNVWGLAISHIPQLGLGGDVDGRSDRGPVKNADVSKSTEIYDRRDGDAVPGWAVDPVAAAQLDHG